MRFGLRLRRRHEAEPLEAPSSRPEARAGDPTSGTLPAVDEPDRQLSPEALDEQAEILVRIAPEALAGDAELSGEVGEIEGQTTLEPPDEVAGVAQTERPARAAEAADPVSDTAAIDPGAAPNVSVDGLSKQASASADGDPGGAETHAPNVDLQAQPEPDGPVAPLPADDPSLQIRLARIHLRTGSFTTARVELEMLASRDRLDMAALLDLAEARWRTGDLDGAGDAASAYLDDGGTKALGFVIAAEAAAMANRHADARRHAEEALARHLSELDPVFAGMPRKAIWTSNARTSAAPATPAVEPAAPAVAAGAGLEPGEVSEPAAGDLVETDRLVAEPLPSGPVESPDAGDAATDSVVEPAAEVAAGRSCLQNNEPLMAALHLGVAIRLAPELAGVVLEAIGERQDLPLRLLRGDALRLLGLDGDAAKAYLSVASGLGAPRSVQPESERATTFPAAVDPEAPAEEPPPLR